MIRFYFIISAFSIITLLAGCSTSKKVTLHNGNNKATISDTIISPYKFKECPSREDCATLFDCYHDFFFHPLLLDYNTRETSSKYFNFRKLLECTVYVFNTDSSRKEQADKCLYSYIEANYYKYTKPMPTGDLSNYPLKSWISKRAFESHLLYMSKNYHDSMGHGDCTNVGVKFFNKIVLPKIRTIYGEKPLDYLGKHLPYDNEANEKDCGDALYNVLYPLIKQAWEEGKIELHAPEIK